MMSDFANPKFGLSGINATMKRTGMKRDEVEKGLKSQEGYQLNYQNNIINYFPIIAYKEGSYQFDLMFPPKFKGIGVILCCINISTRYLYAYCFKTKDKTYEYIEKFLQDTKRDKREVSFIQMDRGSEFTNNKVKELFENIDYRYVNVADKRAQGIVERVNGTIRRLINNYISSNNNNDWVSVFDDLIYNYNHRFHRGLGDIPANADELTLMKNQVERYKLAKKDFDKFKVGNSVRVSKNKDIFDKGRKTWSDNVYKIVGIEGNKFLLDNDELYRHYELQKVVVESKNTKDDYDKIAKQDKRNNKIIRALKKEGILDGVDHVIIRRKSQRIKTTFDETLVGRRVKRSIHGKSYEGTIIEYDKEGPYHFRVKFDVVPKGRNDVYEFMSIKEIKLYLI